MIKKAWNPAEFAYWLGRQEASIRTRALADLSGDQRKRYNEWTTFEGFYRAHGLNIRPASVTVCDPPKPDIYCVRGSFEQYFELGEIVMQQVGRNASISAESGGMHAGPISTVQPLLEMFRKKCSKSYKADGLSICLLLHFNVGHQSPIGWRPLASLLAPGEFEVSQFDSVFVYDGWSKCVLETLTRP